MLSRRHFIALSSTLPFASFAQSNDRILGEILPEILEGYVNLDDRPVVRYVHEINQDGPLNSNQYHEAAKYLAESKLNIGLGEVIEFMTPVPTDEKCGGVNSDSECKDVKAIAKKLTYKIDSIRACFWLEVLKKECEKEEVLRTYKIEVPRSQIKFLQKITPGDYFVDLQTNNKFSPDVPKSLLPRLMNPDFNFKIHASGSDVKVVEAKMNGDPLDTCNKVFEENKENCLDIMFKELPSTNETKVIPDGFCFGLCSVGVLNTM